ncbi:hypothetical protein [Streptomyces oceani]|uniref:Proteinase inhibitor I78 n=1 Tax=Streptomyces oceani TaxID=1075402 RepID=A0A1E7KGT0_9ACTN|nr:hypothetical protein [Streptomyces oceani]OEV03131.1 hypothetical protein AN216_13060 [Streptomyces oceani]
MAPDPAGADTPQDDTEGYVGLLAETAEQRARERGWTTVRAVAPDAIITMEYLSGRINFAVREGAVVRCWKG